MSYTTPIYDRTNADIVNLTSKAYLNLVDWQRIDGNTIYVVGELMTKLGASISQATVATMTKSTIPLFSDVNDLSGNIEAMRTWIVTNYPAEAPSIDPNFTEVKDDYISGDAQDYIIVNHWEQVVDIAYQWVESLILSRYARTGVAICGAGLTRNNSWRG